MKQSNLKIITLMLALFLSFSSVALASDPYGNFNYGSGTENDPFLISTSDDLVMMSDVFRNNPELGSVFPFYAVAYYELTDNIDMSGINWYPISDIDTKLFLGDFNGAGYTIYNLERDTGNGSTGFFGYMGGNLHDLNLVNVNFAGRPTGTYYGIGGAVGGLGYGGVIQNVNVKGMITVGGSYGRNGGGIVGMVWGANARISNSTFDGYITGLTADIDILGGIVGFVNATGLVVENCYSAGDIVRQGTGPNLVGKIAGSPRDATFINDTTSMIIYANTYGGPDYWAGYDGEEAPEPLIIEAGILSAMTKAANLFSWSLYTSDTWADFEPALLNAQFTLENPTTQAAADSALASLAQAINGLEEAPPPVLAGKEASAFVTKLSGNQNDLTITVMESYSDGSTKPVTATVKISNNAVGTYNVGAYKVYVATKAVDQVTDCHIVD